MPHRTPQKRGEKVVRAAGFDRAMDAFNAEMGQKVAMSIKKYHEDFVEPRLKWLETPLWRRAVLTVVAWAGSLWGWFKGLWKKPEPVDFGVGTTKNLKKGDPVETTEAGDKLFEGEHQTGTVTGVDAEGRVSVIMPGEDDPMVYSESVWQRARG